MEYKFLQCSWFKSRRFKAGEINEEQYKEATREVIKDYGKDIDIVFLDESIIPEKSKGSIGSGYILDNGKTLIPIDISKIEDTGSLWGVIEEEVSHVKDGLEGRQDKKVAEDKSNDEEGLESLGRPANYYVKNKIGDDNNSKIKLSTDGIDLTNADVGEKVGDVITPEDRKERARLHKENKEFEKILNRGSKEFQQQISKRKKEFEKALEYLNDPERREQIKNGIIDGLIGVGVVTAGTVIAVAAISSGPGGWVAIGSTLISSEVAFVGGGAAVVAGTARIDYGNKKIDNALFDDELKEPKHLIADTLFKNYKEEYYLGEAMLGAGMLHIAPHTFPIGTVGNIPLQQGALPYYTNTYSGNTTNLPVATNAGNTSLALYKNPKLFLTPIGTNGSLSTVPLLSLDGANKVSQVPALPNYLTKPEYGGTLVIAAGTEPKSGAYNTDINPKVAGAHFGDATNFKGIPDNFFSLVIIDNPDKFNPFNPEILRVVKEGGEIRITGVISNSYFSQLYSKNRKIVKVPEVFELVKQGYIVEEERKQGYRTDGKPIGQKDGVGEGKKTDRIIVIRKKEKNRCIIMKIKLKVELNWEIWTHESYITMPIILNRTMIFGAYNVDFRMTDSIWQQLPEEYKRKIYKYNWKNTIKFMLITITEITAYSFCFGSNIKLKNSIIMEEIYENFNENKKIEFLTSAIDFPCSSTSVYFQHLGEVYAEVDLDELVAISDEENSSEFVIMHERIEPSNYRKKREKNIGKLEQIYNEQLIVKNIVNKYIDELSREEIQKVLDNFLLIDNLKYLAEVIKKSKELEVVISDKLKDEIEHWLRDIQIKIKTEEEEKICEEIKEILKEQLWK